MNTDPYEGLTKKERKALHKELSRQENERIQKTMQRKKYLYVLIGVLVILLLGFGVYKWATRPMPGKTLPELGRNHVPLGTKVAYNSDPPTSGDHFEEWEKPGIYKEPLQDLKLVHSLEHGYIIISYNCNVSQQNSTSSRKTTIVNAQEPTPAQSSSSGTQDNFKSEDCQELVKKLETLANDQRLWKLIVVPRPTMKDRIALTAWTHIETMNTFDENKIKEFISAYRDHGPEQTME